MTSIETGPTWSERLNPRNWTLAWKLAVVGLVPALLALSLGVLRVADQAGVAADLGRSSRLLAVREQVAGAADALRQERDEATLYAAGNRIGNRGVLEIDFGQTDREIAEMLDAVRSAPEIEPTTVAAVLSQTDAGLNGLTALRKDVIDPPTEFAAIRDRYTRTIETVDVLDRSLLRQLRTPGTAGLTEALSAVRGTTAQLGYQHTLLGSAIRASQLLPADADAVKAAEAQILAEYRQYQVALAPEQLARFGNFLDDPANVERRRLETVLLDTPTSRPITLAPNELDAAYDGSRVAADRSADLIRQELATTSTAAEEEASNLAGINSVILMLGLLLGITIALLVARSLIRSLRVLRTAALDVAERRLPQAVESMRAGGTPDLTVDPVPLTSRDEVGQVARAFDAVHGQAIRLAADQAALQANVSAMFVNLSRRSQALVERQLQLIEQLESNEQDADQLSNLFQLDHLATRMRRNSENLLVLAGTDLAKRNIAPVPMVDVLRAAVSEVEQYQRVVVQAPPSATIVGRAASDLVHLLAELLDNATNFSPPDSQVVMSTTRTSDGSILVEIADRGVGMIDHELTDANQRLGGLATVDVSASRRMGLFVVGRLGARHAIGVQLSTTGAVASGGGLTASVTVPAYLLPSARPVEDGRPIGVPSAASVPAQGSTTFSVPPQRAGMNGNGRAGSLSALVAGTDGPANPTGIFDTPTIAGSEGALFSPPTSQSPTTQPPTNGGPPGLPTRRPGSSLRPDRPVPSARPEHAEQAQAEAAAAGKAREVADQARLDQEAAERADQDRAERDQVVSPSAEPADRPDTGDRDGAQNGSPPHPGRTTDATTPAASTNGTHGAMNASPAEDDTRSDESVPAAATADPAGRPATESRPGALPQRATAAPRVVPPSPPTTPMPLVGRGPATEAAPTARPGTQQPVQQQPVQQQPVQQRPVQQRPGAGPNRFPERPGPRPQPVAQAAAPADRPPYQRPDELFAPSVPVIAEPEASMPVRRDDDNGRSSGFDLGETTPIFAEIASAWFRSNRPVPVIWETEEPEAEQPAPEPVRPQPEARLAPSPAPARQPRPFAPPIPGPVAEPAPEVAVPASVDRGFTSVADEGWRAASGAETDRDDELTSAGLPKRRPRARLVPGSAGSAVLAPPVSATRSAETIRGRLASYQQGVRQGRESRMRGDTGAATADSGTEPATAGGHHDEESS